MKGKFEGAGLYVQAVQGYPAEDFHVEEPAGYKWFAENSFGEIRVEEFGAALTVVYGDVKIDADGRGDHAAQVVAVVVPFDPGADAGDPGAEYKGFMFVFKGLYKIF